MTTRSNSAPAIRRNWLWPAAIIALLGVHALAMAIVVFVATRDPSFAVEPNSYRKAVLWDNAQARRQASAQLGWAALIQTSDKVDLLGRRHVTFSLTDRDGVPVVAAKVSLEVFHHARAAERVYVQLTPDASGRYSADLPMRRAGTWEFRITAERYDSTYATVVTQEVGEAS